MQELLDSGRLRLILHRHDDAEVKWLLRRWLAGRAGFRPLRDADVIALHAYLGGELALYFAWASLYTRCLWWPSLLGLVVLVIEYAYARPTIESQAGGGDAERVYLLCTAGYSLLLLLWAAALEQLWKRRVAYLRVLLDLEASESPSTGSGSRTIISPNFREEELRRGFYTQKGLWVDLEDAKPKVSTKTGEGMHSFWHSPPSSSSTSGAALVETGAVQVAAQEDGADSSAEGGAAPSSATSKELKAPRVRFASGRRRARKQLATVAVLSFMGATCLLVMLAIMWLRLKLESSPWVERWQGSAVVSALSALVMMVLNSTWRRAALGFTHWINYRLSNEFAASLVYTMFAFQFLNCYSPLFYLAFVKSTGPSIFGAQDSCERRREALAEGEESCLDLVRSQLLAILLLNAVVGNAVELGDNVFRGLARRVLGRACIGCCLRRSSPITPEGGIAAERLDSTMEFDDAQRRKVARLLRDARGDLEQLPPADRQWYLEFRDVSDLVNEFELAPLKAAAHGLSPTFYEYNELILQFGYIFLFGCVLPVGAALALLNNLVELRSDLNKMLSTARRVSARDVSGGSVAWQRIFSGLLLAGVLSNLALLCFTSELLDSFGISELSQRAAIFFSVENLLLLLYFLFARFIPNVPKSVRVRDARAEWMLRRAQYTEKQSSSATENAVANGVDESAYEEGAVENR